MTTTDTQVRDWEKEFVEEAAELEHERWARWQHYLHSKCIWNSDGTLTIPAELVERWQRQIVTPYVDLSESEKESDRKEARTYVPLIDKILKADRTYLAGKVGKYAEEIAMLIVTTDWQNESSKSVDRLAEISGEMHDIATINQ